MKIARIMGVFLLAFVVILSGCGKEQVGVSREFSSKSVASGEEVQVTLKVTLGGSKWYLIDEKLPAGVEVIDSSSAITEQSGHLKWLIGVFDDSAVDTTYTYTIKLSNPGNNVFTGVYAFDNTGDEALTIIGDDTITVG
jgi:hypothetical protein